MKKYIRPDMILLGMGWGVILMLGLMFSATAMAKPQELSWNWPTTDCDGAALAVADLFASEIAVDTAPMDMPSDTAGPCTATADPDAPATAMVTPVTMPNTSITLNLQPGITYYARIRVSSFVAGNWSSWSTQISFQVPYGKPGQPIWLN
jgi:hypothetical protein